MNIPKYIPVEGTKYVRDTSSGAILNTDKREYDDYKIKKQLNDKEKREKEEVKNRMNRIEKDMQEIKEILLKLSNLGNKDGN
jgi:hypothetical protein